MSKYHAGMSHSLNRTSTGSQIKLADDLPFEVSNSFHSFQHAFMCGE